MVISLAVQHKDPDIIFLIDPNYMVLRQMRM